MHRLVVMNELTEKKVERNDYTNDHNAVENLELFPRWFLLPYMKQSTQRRIRDYRYDKTLDKIFVIAGTGKNCRLPLPV